jgi:hypothetical protein
MHALNSIHRAVRPMALLADQASRQTSHNVARLAVVLQRHPLPNPRDRAQHSRRESIGLKSRMREIRT